MIRTSDRLWWYWVTTAFLALELAVGGAMDLTRGREVVVIGAPVDEVVSRLGYPVYLLLILGVWKLLGAAALVAPRFPRLKEWAYAGVVFEMTAAAASHAVAGDALYTLVYPLFVVLLALASWALRPGGRVLGA
jgi:uncharacterized membrane protein YphA (DoxX/SURF4 family)